MKKELRKDALQRRETLLPDVRKAKSEQIRKYILNSEGYRKAKRIFVYVSMGAEVETRAFIQQAWLDGKIVAVPKTEKNRVMYFFSISSFAELEKSRFGVMEPKGTKETELYPERGDLFLVPGVLFDEKRNRLGYGGGYYDTYFERTKNQGFRKIGLAFSLQVQKEDLPTEKLDIPLDAIITEDGWIGGETHE